jgi:hypothetical protein
MPHPMAVQTETYKTFGEIILKIFRIHQISTNIKQTRKSQANQSHSQIIKDELLHRWISFLFIRLIFLQSPSCAIFSLSYSPGLPLPPLVNIPWANTQTLNKSKRLGDQRTE